MEKEIINSFNNLTIEQTERLLGDDIEMKISDKDRNRIKISVFEKAGLKKKRGFYMQKKLVAGVVVIIVFACFMAFTTPGRTLAQNIIEKIFPPKNIELNIEGMPEDKEHQAHVVSGDEEALLSGYVIYIDETHYNKIEKNGTDVILPIPVEISRNDILEDMGHLWEGLSKEEIDKKIDERIAELEAFYSSLPECMMQISQQAGVSPQKAAYAEFNALKLSYKNVSEIESSVKENDGMDGLKIISNNGNKGNDAVEYTYFIDNKKGGTFLIRIKFFNEAAEGHGSRLAAALRTFAIIE